MTNKKNIMILICSILFITTVSAQDSTRYSTLSLGIGLNRVLNKDLFHSPYTYRGNNLSLYASYSGSRPKTWYNLDVAYSRGNIQSIVSPPARNHLFVLNFDYLFRLKNTGSKFSTHLGAGITEILSSTNYLPGIESPVTYHSTSVSLAFSSRLSYTFNKKHKISLETRLPLAGIAYRPDFEVNGKTYIGAQFPFKDFWFSSILKYEYNLNNRYSILVKYHYSYFSYKQPRSIALMQNGMFFGIARRF